MSKRNIGENLRRLSTFILITILLDNFSIARREQSTKACLFFCDNVVGRPETDPILFCRFT